MSSSYTGNPTATQAPGAQPAEGVYPTLALPTDGDPNAASTFLQSLKECADYIAFLMRGAGQDHLFGTGADGDATIATSPMNPITTPFQYNNLTLSTGVTCDPRAPIQVRGTLTLEGTAMFNANGVSGDAGGAGTDNGWNSRGYLRGGTSGGVPGSGSTGNPVAAYQPFSTLFLDSDQATLPGVVPGGNGGDGADDGAAAYQLGATWSPVGWTPTAAGILSSPPGFWAGPVDNNVMTPTSRFVGLHAIAGGMGGGAGHATLDPGDTPGTQGGHYGGAGGGVIWIAARHIVIANNVSTGLHFSAQGGAGQSGGTNWPNGPGGGGGGGNIVIVYRTFTVGSGSVYLNDSCSAAGGAAGSGGHSSHAAQAGSAGNLILIQLPPYGY